MRSLIFIVALFVIAGVVSADCEGVCHALCNIICRLVGSTCEESHCEGISCYFNCTNGHEDLIGHDEMMNFKIEH
ncbi:unnamed protein product [Bursaphelenchus xylophilus]|uniref:(pine wood nematode) hypothetical protein n=1 Tax=Bursaphelenchus xylophilus TaxID=6326 RepID=A0A811LWH6_BURXY|nr:unnamed protein product [Bursaphelenchus xylophilus]CAG9125652.1 unnamed protein product [Bursaphelenchus xylophilus]